jgi:two-component system response regulator NreC
MIAQARLQSQFFLFSNQSFLNTRGKQRIGRAAVDWMDREQADVAVMDVGMPGLNGIEATARILRKHPEVGVVMLSMHRDETYVLRRLRAGARGYILKESAEHELIAAIGRCARASRSSARK